MNKEQILKRTRGISITPITPFKEDGSIDEDGIVRLVEFFFENGIQEGNGFLVPLSTTGNFLSLSLSEKKKIVSLFTRRFGDKIPIVVGCNNVNQAEAIELARYAEDQGAVGVMIGPPFYWAATKEQIIHFFDRVCRSIQAGVMIYNNHWASQVDLSVEMIGEIARNQNVFGMKESTYSIPKLMHVIQKYSHRINIHNGLGEAYEPFYAQAGAAGFTSTIANIVPEYSVKLQGYLAGKEYEKAGNLARVITPLADFLDSLRGGQYIAALKWVLHRSGICECTVRPPVIALTRKEIETLEGLVASTRSEFDRV